MTFYRWLFLRVSMLWQNVMLAESRNGALVGGLLSKTPETPRGVPVRSIQAAQHQGRCPAQATFDVLLHQTFAT